MWKKFIGDKKFYRMVTAVALPIIIQNAITNSVSLLDNVMVGRIGTESMSAVAIVNQLIFVFSITIFGAISGPGIFTAQFYGRRDHDGVRYTFRMKLILCSLIALVAVLLFIFAGAPLIELYIHESDGQGDIVLTRSEAIRYLSVMIIGLVPFAISQAYSSTLRETGETVLPMISSSVAVGVNIVFNFILIYGVSLGTVSVPALGVQGAAVATVISRFVELAIIVLFAHVRAHRGEFEFLRGAFRSVKIPLPLIRRAASNGAPLLLNETCWSMGMALIAQCYSTRGIDAVAAYNISSTVVNLFNVCFISIGAAIAVIVGNLLGAGRLKEARETNTRLIALSLMCCVVIGLVMALLAPLFPLMYDTAETVRRDAAALITVTAVFMPTISLIHAAYSTLRTGGRTVLATLMDSVLVLCVNYPLALLVTSFTSLNIIWVFVLVNLCEVLRAVIGLFLVKSDVWLRTL